jgi:hypothetical protein
MSINPQIDFFEDLMNGRIAQPGDLVKRALQEKVHIKSLREKMANGTRCPCCGQQMRIYKYCITGEMARVLLFLYRLFSEYPNCQPVHLESVLRKVYGTKMPRGNKHSLLRHWGLIGRSETRYSKHLKQRTGGCYTITEKGIDFSKGNIKIPKWIYVYDNVCLGVSLEESVNIVQTIGQKFSLSDCLSEPVDFSKIETDAITK